MSNFSGHWFTTFGPMELTQSGMQIRGFYLMHHSSCPIEGSMRDGKFHFTYQEPAAEGEGWFELVRYGKFAGQWRAKGAANWSSWSGQREFEGIWETSFGLLRLVQEPEQRFGFYESLVLCTLAGATGANDSSFAIANCGRKGKVTSISRQIRPALRASGARTVRCNGRRGRGGVSPRCPDGLARGDRGALAAFIPR